MTKYYYDSDEATVYKCTIRDEDVAKGAILSLCTFDTFHDAWQHGLESSGRVLEESRVLFNLRKLQNRRLWALQEIDAETCDLVLDYQRTKILHL